MKKVRVQEAIGMVLGHDITMIIPGEFKGAAFSRGHIIVKEDIPRLLSLGKEHVYIMELGEDEVHEEEAARRIARAICGLGVEFGLPREGKINLKARTYGLLRVNRRLLKRINALGGVIVATMHDNTVCRAETVVAATRIVPLYTTKTKVKEVERLCDEGRVVEVIPFEKRRVGVVITGNEVFKGRIEDKFGAVIKKKIEVLGSVVNHQIIVPDVVKVIAWAVSEMKNKGSEVIVICGGLSVDPDDVTVEGVGKSGAKILNYGAPVIPGAMFLLARLGNIPVLGAPACVIYNKTTIFDLILPRILAGEKVRRGDIVEIGHGGLCLNCEECSFPVCPFGK